MDMESQMGPPHPIPGDRHVMPEGAPLTDAQLVPFLRQGNASAFEEVLKRYEVKAYNLARSLTRNDEDARDALQDAFLSVFRSVKSFKGESSLSTWIYRITVNAALMLIRKRKHDDKAVSIDEYMPAFDGTGHRVAALPDWHPQVDELLMKKELGERLGEAVKSLPSDYRTVFVLRDQEGLSNDEVAAVLELSVAAVKSRLHRARLFLRERMKRYVYEGT
jgi:RNA polymerase sigma-70 factor (ECF subfamily)